MTFTLLGFPVRVEWSFFLMTAILGWRGGDLAFVFIWGVVVFVSVLVHELGHAMTGHAFGLHSSIVLHSLGGETQFSPSARLRPSQQMLLSAAGPLFGFALGAFTYVCKAVIVTVHSPYLDTALRDLLWVNFGWGLINLLPILPLDGGHIMASLVPSATHAKWLSFGTSVLAALVGLWAGHLWAMILFVWLAYANVQSLRVL